MIERTSSLQILKICNFHRNNQNKANNLIGNEGVKLIFNSLCQNKTLQELFLEENKLSGEIGLEISGMLKNNANLQKLYLNNNELGNKGIEEISYGLENNAGLKYLDLCMNFCEI